MFRTTVSVTAVAAASPATNVTTPAIKSSGCDRYLPIWTASSEVVAVVSLTV